jgi:hypothetical protein
MALFKLLVTLFKYSNKFEFFTCANFARFLFSSSSLGNLRSSVHSDNVFT